MGMMTAAAPTARQVAQAAGAVGDEQEQCAGDQDGRRDGEEGGRHVDLL